MESKISFTITFSTCDFSTTNGFSTEHFRKAACLKIANVGEKMGIDDALVGFYPNFCTDISNKLNEELLSLLWNIECYDNKGDKVFNKLARYDIFFANNDQECEDGRVYDIKKLPFLRELRKRVHFFLNNYGYNINIGELIGVCYQYCSGSSRISFREDGERRLVFGVHVSSYEIPLHFAAWQNKKYIEDSIISFDIKPGTAYVISEKASGNNCEKREDNLITFRYAVGLMKSLGNTLSNNNSSSNSNSETTPDKCIKCRSDAKYGIGRIPLCGKCVSKSFILERGVIS